jgi:thiol-disulfide isomerase/thioredoxin
MCKVIKSFSFQVQLVFLLSLACTRTVAFSPHARQESYFLSLRTHHEPKTTWSFMAASSDESSSAAESSFVTFGNNDTDVLNDSSTAPQFGQVVQLRRPSTEAASTSPFLISDTNSIASTSGATDSSISSIQSMLQRNALVAVASIILALSNYAWQYSHPLSSLQLLSSMQASSPSLSIIGTNRKPTLVQFWAPWCQSCKEEAPTMYKIHEQFQDKVNFVLVNGDLNDAYTTKAIETFGVDAIPHVALVDATGNVETALIGMIPKHVLEQDLTVLIQHSDNESLGKKTQLPYQMMDAFANRPNERKVHFEDSK